MLYNIVNFYTQWQSVFKDFKQIKFYYYPYYCGTTVSEQVIEGRQIVQEWGLEDLKHY